MYVCVPPTVVQACADNQIQRARLKKWQRELEQYTSLCPQLQEPIRNLRNLLEVLNRQISTQETLIQQRIQLQATLAHYDFTSRKECESGLSSPALLSLQIPPLENKATRAPIRLHTRPTTRLRPRALEINEKALHPTLQQRKPSNSTLVLTSHSTTQNRYGSKTYGTGREPCFSLQDSTGLGSPLSSIPFPRLHDKNKPHQSSNIASQVLDTCDARQRQRQQCLTRIRQNLGRSNSQESEQWSPVPAHLKGFPSIFEQLIKLKTPRISSETWKNRFAPLYSEFREDIDSIMETVVDNNMITQRDSPPEDMPMESPDPSPTQNKDPTYKVTMDVLRDLVPVSELDTSSLQVPPATYAAAIQVAPQGFEKIRFECHIGRFSRDSNRTERILSLFEIAKRYDKNVCLCPSGKEPHPVLYSPRDIKQSRIYRYFQDKPGAQKPKYANSLYGYVVFGVTGDVEDFVAAMKDWAVSNRHELIRHGVQSTSVIAGFITHASLTLNRDDAVAAIKKTEEWVRAGCPEFSLQVRTLWSAGGADAKVPAICCDCERDKLAEFVQMCETLFFGENLSLPASLREVYFFNSRSFPAASPTRRTYIAEQRDFLASDRTVTVGGLGDVYQDVRLRSDPQYSSTIEDVIMLMRGTSGPLFRSMDRTVDGKVFLKLEDTNLSAWAVRQGQLADHLRTIVHPDDLSLVFREDSQELSFSDPWIKFKDGQMARNVVDMPSRASLEYVDRCKAKFATAGVVPGSAVKKRAHSNVSSDGTATTYSTTSTNATPRFHTTPPQDANLAPIDLTRDERQAGSSPSHKVHVVEQRTYQGGDSPLSSIAGSMSPTPTAVSPKTARMQKLEQKVAAHDVKLTAIQSSVAEIDSKIDDQSKKTAFHFDRFEEMLSHIHGTIVAGISQTPAKEVDVSPESMQEGPHDDDGAYNPIQSSHEWNETWRRDQAHRGFIATQRDEYAEQLRKEAAAQGRIYDYYAVAYERYPSPPPIQYPDDITYTDDL